MAKGVRTGTSFHRSDETYLRNIQEMIARKTHNGDITPQDAGLLREYLAEITAESGISPVRQYKIAIQIVGLRRFLPPFAGATAGDLYTAVNQIRAATGDDGAPLFKQNTISDMIRFLRRFYLWMIENGYSAIPEAKVKKIKPPAYQRMTKTAEEILTEDEIRAMLEAARTPKDRALLAILYESGCRIGELGTLTWGQVKFTNWNVTLNVNGKTKKPRYIPLVIARPYLAAWKAAYPKKITPEAHVFLTATTQLPLQYAGVVKQFRIIAERAGVTKHITPHLFRHSRITHLIQQGMSESVIKLMMWGSLTTSMFQTYAHLTNRDIDSAMAKLTGVTTEEEERSVALEAKQCPRCHSVNGPTYHFCATCGLALDQDAEIELRGAQEATDEYYLKKILNNPVMLEKLTRTLQSITEASGSTRT